MKNQEEIVADNKQKPEENSKPKTDEEKEKEIAKIIGLVVGSSATLGAMSSLFPGIGPTVAVPLTVGLYRALLGSKKKKRNRCAANTGKKRAIGPIR